MGIGGIAKKCLGKVGKVGKAGNHGKDQFEKWGHCFAALAMIEPLGYSA